MFGQQGRLPLTPLICRFATGSAGGPRAPRRPRQVTRIFYLSTGRRVGVAGGWRMGSTAHLSVADIFWHSRKFVKCQRLCYRFRQPAWSPWARREGVRSQSHLMVRNVGKLFMRPGFYTLLRGIMIPSASGRDTFTPCRLESQGRY